MCGITGQVVGPGDAVDRSLVHRMTRALAHRGPDGERTRFGDQYGFGHRRLSLIDLAGGDQPLSNEDGSVWVISNSEIYNYVELRQQLGARGHRFATSSDTEVIVHLYEDLGAACVGELVGMFAFAVWDQRRRTLLLARDRFGIKPLYYSTAGATLLFASEMKALLESPAVGRDFNYRALDQYFRHLTIPEPDTAFTSVRKLPAAHVLEWRDGASSERRYWDITTSESDASALTEGEALERLDSALGASVALSLRSDVPVGVFLSGGVDSSLLTWFASRVQPATETFSLAFEDPRFDERAFSRAVARTCGTIHHEVELTRQEAADTLRTLAQTLDEPFADSSAIPTYLLAKAARTRVKAVLTGEGADELFGGSPWHLAGGALAPDIDQILNPPAKIVFPATDLDALYTDDLRQAMSRAPLEWPAGVRDRLDRCAGSFEQRLSVDLDVYLPSDLLMKTDRMTMLASLEARVPFLNHPFAEFAWHLPERLKLKDGVRKYALKRLGAGKLPAEILNRPKQGFSIPMDVWLWSTGAFRDMVFDTLLDRRTRSRGQFKMPAVESMIQQHDRLQRVHGYRLWTLFVFETWQRQFVDRPVAVAS